MNGIWEMNAWALIKLGGPIMVPILLCSIFALAITIEKFFYFASINVDTSKLKKDIFDAIKNNQIKEAITLCDNNRSPVAKILKAGIIKFGSSREDIKENIEEASLFEIPKLESRLGILATIAHVSPFLGLLGTATGIIATFNTIQMRSASMNPITAGNLAGGIGEALITTVAGLMVAVPTFIAYNYCVSRINHLTLDMERAATDLINFMRRITESGAR